MISVEGGDRERVAAAGQEAADGPDKAAGVDSPDDSAGGVDLDPVEDDLSSPVSGGGMPRQAYRSYPDADGDPRGCGWCARPFDR